MEAAARRVRMTLRTEESVKPLELFFDLVFVLAITQCTVLMADDPTWEGIARGLLVLGVLWWSWVGYSWLTSVVDPEEGIVRFAIFGAMAALLVVALCVPEAFGDLGLLFACAYFVVRIGQVDPACTTPAAATRGCGARSAGWRSGPLIGTSILIVASFTDGALQGALWALALALDVGEPYVFGSEGWKLAPRHFVERHGLIIIIALGESIVSIGPGVEGEVDAGVVAAAVLGVGWRQRCGGSTSTSSRSSPNAA